MRQHKGLKYVIGISAVIIVVVLYMIVLIRQNNQSEVIYFISKTSSENSTFWHSVERGVQVASDELGLDLVFVGPEREQDLDDQVALVRQAIDHDPMAIILAASDYTALAEVSEEVMSNHITFLTVDSDVAIEEDHSFIASNNIKASELLAHEMAKMLDETGLVGIISHLEGTTSAIDREAGFRQGIEGYQGIDLIEEIPYSNNDAYVAYNKALKFIEQYPQVEGLFATNEATLIGIARAVDAMKLQDQIHVVGFDISDTAASYLEKDVIQAIVIQRPFNMGYLSVVEAYEQAKHYKAPEVIDVDIVLVTIDNMFDEENQKFLIPFLE